MKTMRSGLVISTIGMVMLLCQTPSIAQMGVTGRVVDDDTGRPVPNVRVSLIADASDVRPVVLTDADGLFTFDAQPGRYRISAIKTGYALHEITYATSGQPIDIRIQRGAAIFGRVIDDAGEPIIGAGVTAETPAGAVVATSDTDDRGEYRLGGLRPDTLVVAVRTTGGIVRQERGPNQVVMMPSNYKTFYPGVASVKEAETLTVRSSDERGGIDFIVPSARSGNQPFTVMRQAGIAIAGNEPAGRITGKSTASIRGYVLGVNGGALPNALVRLLRNGSRDDGRIIRANFAGQFEFTDLPAGTYRLAASKNGYFPADRTVGLAEGQKRERVDVTLPHWGTIEGRVLDELGDPLQGARVELLQLRYEAGRRRLVPTGEVDTTNDLGAYRLYGLYPGTYLVSAAIGAVQSADVPGYGRSFFPGTPVPAQAQFVSTVATPELVGIDIMMSRAPTARVTGQLLDAAGRPTMGGSVTLMPSQRSDAATSISVGARISPNGRFEFPNVPPGQYVIQAYRGRQGTSTEGEFGALPVTVGDAAVDDLVLRMSAGSSIQGRITFDTFHGTREPAPSAIELTPIPTDFDQSPQSAFATASISANWGFVINGINGPRRLQLTRPPAGWALKEIRANGIDVTDQPIFFGRNDLADVEVVLTDRVNEIGGTVMDDRSRPIGSASVIVFSTDRSKWYHVSRFVAKTTSADLGEFTLSGLPYGTYYAAAITQDPIGGPDAWQDPEFLESLVSRASTITLGDGQKVSIGLKIPAR